MMNYLISSYPLCLSVFVKSLDYNSEHNYNINKIGGTGDDRTAPKEGLQYWKPLWSVQLFVHPTA